MTVWSIERTISLVLGPFTALYRSFLAQRTLTNRAMGTIWRDLSKPPQRRQGIDPRPLWLLVGTPLISLPDGQSIPTLADVFIYFWYTVFIILHVCVIFLWPLRFSWLLVLGLYKEDIIYTFLNVYPLITQLLLLMGRLGSRKPV